MNNIITKAIRPFIMIALAAGITACGDWLDVKPYDKDLETTIFSNEAQIQAAHNGLYLLLATDGLYGMQMTAGTVDLLGQQYAWYNSSSNDLSNTKYAVMNYQYAEDNVKKRFELIWLGMYNAVLNVNRFIDRLSVTEGIVSQEHKELMLGEAYAMRAFLHFDLLRLFGPPYKSYADETAIPYYTTSKIGKKEMLSARAVAGKVLADVEIALSMLANDPILRTGVNDSSSAGVSYYSNYRNNRLNYYAVCLLKARVLHYMGNDAKTEEFVRSILSGVDKTFDWTTQEAVNHAKSPDMVFYPEVLFGIHDENMYKNWKDYFSGEIIDFDLVYLKSTNELINALNVTNMVNVNDFRAKQWNDFINPERHYYFSVKFKQPSVPWNGSYFRPLMRKSELYYILSECSGEVSWMNTVKEKRFNTILATAVTDSELAKEYMLEMFGEGQLFYFYKRREMTPIRSGSAIGTGAVTVNIAMTKDKYMPPIPESETSN